ncbi:uncharacterized protein LOC115922663 [Strongylocentrotus purpuratus]|uniref:Sulfotransferase family protein n=1 Tax=Strongylocentrotus purpuratus TaxID=7668 RepID=A0A7M7NK60_STRPU|nr:uncharacterized protein LOC115922663 [Strongylocentrotus purpuratus]
MSARGDTEVFWEPHFSCYFFGPEGAERIAELPFDGTEMTNDKYTYSYLKELLRAEYPGSKILFVKDMVESIKNDFDVVDRGYKQSFIIRHPRKTFRSLYRSNEARKGTRDSVTMIQRLRDMYHILERFYRYVEAEFDQGSPPIIDADDLVNHPGKLLPKYCEAMGIEYTPKMLEWESVDAEQLTWHCTDIGIFTKAETRNSLILSNAMKGQGFGKAPDLTKDIELPAAVEAMISYALPVYEKLNELRIQP